MEKRKDLNLSPLMSKGIEVKDIKLKASLDFNLKDNKNKLTPRQKEMVDNVTQDIISYLQRKAKAVKTDEWIELAKTVALLSIAIIRKDKILVSNYLKDIGAFLLKHFLPDFYHENKLFTLAKVGDKVKFEIKEKA